jgi:hypothetical protein
MSASQGPYSRLLHELASLMVTISGESVTMVKRSAPDQALKLKKKQEWDVYLEFLKAMFNLADRVSGLHIPIQEQPQFMDSLEDAVTLQLKTALGPALGPESDQMEVALTIGKAVSESRERYERFRFLATEESPAKAEFFKYLGERIAHTMGASGNGMIIAAATLCASSAIVAMKAALEATAGSSSVDRVLAGSKTPLAPDRQMNPQGSEVKLAGVEQAGKGIGNEIKLVSVMSSVEGEEVETRWGLHPRFKQDLKPEEAQELTRLMNRITQILGTRYAAVAFSADWVTWHQVGHA